jgi:sigma-B regulation protein RsbU (phosphoserine phosphatase)
VRSDEAYADTEFSFEMGDRILVYTDGLSEAENAAGDSFGETALPILIRENQELDAEQFVDLLLKEVLAWSSDGTERQQADDITMLVIDIHDGSMLCAENRRLPTVNSQIAICEIGQIV